MSTMGLVYSPERGDQQQMMLIRTLQDAGTNNNNNNNNRPSTIVPKQNNVSVININSSQLQQTADNDNSRRQQQQQQSQQMPAYDPSRLKKHGKNGQPPPIAVAKRNARERNRVKQVNNGFATLRQHIPGHVAQGYGDRGKKLSKVETLRMAVEYIRGLQRLLAEADGLDFDANQSSQLRSDDSSIMIPSPTGSGYSGSGTHNGSGDVMGLTGSELDDQVMDEADDVEAYDDEDLEEKKDAKRFKEDVRIHSRLSENQNRDRSLQQPRRRVPQPVYYATKQSPSFGDEENIEPLANRNNNNNLLTTYAPIVLQTDIAPIKREIHLLEDTERSPHQQEEAGQVVLATSSPYTGEILIENPETGRLVPLKLEDQLVYVTAATSAEGLPTTTYYRHDLGDAAAVAGSAEFMDVVSWWEQEQGRLQHQQTTHQLGQQRLAHV